MDVVQGMGGNGATLDGLRQEASRRYADYPIRLDDHTTVVLRAPLRLSSENRTKLRRMQSQLGAMQDDPEYADEDLLGLLRDMIRTVADDRERAEVLIDAIGEDLSALQTLFEQYSERTQPGEASHSAN